VATRAARPKPAAAFGIGALLLSALLSGPATASSNVTELRAEPAAELAAREVPGPALIVERPDQIPLGALLDGQPSLRPVLQAQPYPDSLMHQKLADDELVLPLSNPVSRLPPVAEVDDPGDDRRQNSTVDDALRQNSVPVPSVTTVLPGVSDTDMPRFKRQMFRTDI